MSGSDLTPDDSGFDDPDTLAAEFVLGALTSEEMRAVRVRARADAALAAAIAAWEVRLSPLAAAVPPQPPPAALWSRLERAVAALPMEADAPVPLRAAPAPRAAPPVPRRRVWPWQVATVVALAVAAGFAALAYLPQTAELRIAAIGPVGAPPAAFLADVRPNGSVVVTTLSPADVPQDRELELWILPPGVQKVAPLGLLPSGGGKISLPRLPPTGTQLLISQEPRGGSPTGQPTGPVLYSGTLVSR